MININNYITEKLKINKDSKIEYENNQYENTYYKLEDMLCLSSSDPSRKSLKKWVFDNKIHTLQGYMKIQKMFDDFIDNKHIIDNDKLKDLKQFYMISPDNYDEILKDAVSLGECLFKEKRYDGKYYEIRGTKQYLAVRDLDSQNYIVIHGNPYGELG